MKALLICPSQRPAVPHFAASGSLTTTPILGDCVAGHWIEHLAALGARDIQIIAVGNEDLLRASVGDGARWGVRINVIASNVELTRNEAAERYQRGKPKGWLPPPYDVVSMSHLPGCPNLPLFDSYASWFAALIAWMPRALTPARIRVAERSPGIWVGSRARVSPTAKLVGPCWIGDQACVEAGAVVGPGAIIEDRSVIGGKAFVIQSWVGPDTSVGPMTSVANSLAWGCTLIDWRTDSSLHVPDPFLLCSLAPVPADAGTDRFGRTRGAPGHAGAQPNLIQALGTPLGRASNLKLNS
jgi:hypothetical protein